MAASSSANGSKTIVADKAFVPTHLALPFAELLAATAPGMRAQTNPLYKQSFLAVLPIAIVTPVLGMAEGALAAFLDMAKVRVTRGAVAGGNRKMAELTTVQLRAAEAAACIDAFTVTTAALSQPRYSLAATSVGMTLFAGGTVPGAISAVIDTFDVNTLSWTTALREVGVASAATSVGTRHCSLVAPPSPVLSVRLWISLM